MEKEIKEQISNDSSENKILPAEGETDYYQFKYQENQKENLFKKIAKGVGTGGLIVGEEYF